jgi:transposase
MTARPGRGCGSWPSRHIASAPGHRDRPPRPRERELSRGRRKTDTLDAAAAASVAALHGDARPVPAEGSATVLGMLDEHRTNLTRQRTRTVNQLHALMRELLPGGAPTT